MTGFNLKSTYSGQVRIKKFVRVGGGVYIVEGSGHDLKMTVEKCIKQEVHGPHRSSEKTVQINKHI